MIAAKSVFASLAFFWWSLNTMIDGGVVPEPAAQFRGRAATATDGSSVARLPAIPLAGKDSVHMLTAIGFPPPALFFADPDRKWSVGDFEKSDRPMSYSVTDDGDEPHDRSTVTTTTTTTVAGPGENEEATTTAVDDGIVVGHTEHRLQETTTIGDRRDEQTTAATSRPSTERDRCDGFATARPPTVHVYDDNHEQRRRPRPTAILLTSRPLQPPVAKYRFPNVDYTVIRRHHTPVVNLHYFV